MADVRLIIDGRKVAELMRSPSGPLARNLLERATRFQLVARAQAPAVTGCLRTSIVKRFIETPGGIGVSVQTNTAACSPTRTAYGLFVHEGTRPHVIRARKPGGFLKFEMNGQTVFRRQVNHPGTKPNRFFTDNLAAFGDF